MGGEGTGHFGLWFLSRQGPGSSLVLELPRFGRGREMSTGGVGTTQDRACGVSNLPGLSQGPRHETPPCQSACVSLLGPLSQKYHKPGVLF